MNEQDPRVELVRRIAASRCLRSSNRLRDFLFYVTDCAVRDSPLEATEQQIGMHVFGRIAGYNSSEDSIVRTHARLLRQKLIEYFADEGLQEPLTVHIPKGHYLPVFEPRAVNRDTTAAVLVETQIESIPIDSPPPAVPAVTPRFAKMWKIAIACVVLLTSLGLWFLAPQLSRSSLFDRFWKPFLGNNSSLVIYSNALFTGDSRNGLKYASPPEGTAEPTHNLIDSYTGVGEVVGVYELTRLFDGHHSSFTLKRSRLVTWDEAKQRNLIFVGSVAENPSLRDVTSTTDFSLVVGPGFSGIVNQHPKAGEQALYSEPLYSPDRDYAILAYVPGEQAGRHMLIFSGLTTLGTQAAVDLACNADAFDEILRRAVGPHGEIRPFESIIETTIRGGVPLQTRLVVLHTH